MSKPAMKMTTPHPIRPPRSMFSINPSGASHCSTPAAEEIHRRQGMAPNIVVHRTAVFVAALQGVVTQILHNRLHVAPGKARAFVADICEMLIKGMG